MAATKGLCEDEKSLFENIQKGNTGEVVRLLNGEGTRVDCLDENGMSPLQHAAYRGNSELCEILLNRGADVNSNHHQHGYTALMFAALAGSAATTSVLLEAGASTIAVNSVGRNAAQMAAFVGNHLCVSIINSYVPKASIEYYARPQGLETQPKLGRQLVKPLHRLVLRPNVHPVAVALFLGDNPTLYWQSGEVCKVLDLMCEREVKRADANEVMALKHHFLAFFVSSCRSLGTASRDLKKKKDPGASANANTLESEVEADLDGAVRHWLKVSDSDGVQENMEKLVRAGIRQFPYPQCTIVQQLVRGLTPSRRGSEEPPSALVLLMSSVAGSGPRSDDDGQCATCGEIRRATALKRCSACRGVRYCDRRCQKLHWFVHRKRCPSLAREVLEEEQRALNAATATPVSEVGLSEGPVDPAAASEVEVLPAASPSMVELSDKSPEE